jgi:hypothetical protein
VLILKFSEKFKLVGPTCQRPTMAQDRTPRPARVHVCGDAAVVRSSYATACLALPPTVTATAQVSLPHVRIILVVVTEGGSQHFFRYRASPRSILTVPPSLLLVLAPSTSTTASSSSELNLTASHRFENHLKSPAAKSQTPVTPSATEASPAVVASGHGLPQPPVLQPHSQTASCPPPPPEDLPHHHFPPTDLCWCGEHCSNELLLPAAPKLGPPPSVLALAPLPDLAALPAHRQSVALLPSSQCKLHLPCFFKWATSP